jgi:hypothetical protein
MAVRSLRFGNGYSSLPLPSISQLLVQTYQSASFEQALEDDDPPIECITRCCLKEQMSPTFIFYVIHLNVTLILYRLSLIAKIQGRRVHPKSARQQRV